MPKGFIGQMWNYKGSMSDLRALPLGTYTRETCPKSPLVKLSPISENGTKITISIYTSYWCEGPYSREQPVTLCGFALFAYVGSMQMAARSVKTADEIDLVLPGLVEEAAAACMHKGSRELSVSECRKRGIVHHGNCWHTYECPTCSKIHAYDSSG